jgi:hypothetical protein
VSQLAAARDFTTSSYESLRKQFRQKRQMHIQQLTPHGTFSRMGSKKTAKAYTINDALKVAGPATVLTGQISLPDLCQGSETVETYQ